jgi:mutator protein MutT
VYVLGAAAIEALAPGEPAGVPGLVERLLACGAEVRAYPHAAPWIDVNDRSALERAEELVAAHEDLFERWPRDPDVEVAGALILGPEGVLLEWRSAMASAYPAQWDTPGGKIEPGETPADAIARELREELALEVRGARRVAVFDDLEPASARIFRHHVFEVDVGHASPFPRLGQALRWMALDGPPWPATQSPAVRRSVAAWRAGRARGGGPVAGDDRELGPAPRAERSAP